MAEGFTPKIGDVVDNRYELISKLGEGGFGVVYKARQLSTDQLVAVKVLLQRRMREERHKEIAVARFRREMKLVGGLRHPHIVRLIDSGDLSSESLYMVLEYLEGKPLSQYVRERGPLSPELAVHLMSHVLDALHYAHQHGVVHRDLKPQNIMITEGGFRPNAVVLDFGIAGVAEEARGDDYEGLTREGGTLGTPGYMAPEQIAGEGVGPESDVFAWGIMLIECLRGRPALGPDVPVMAALYKQAAAERQELPPEIEAHPLSVIIDRATLKDRGKRYARAEQVIADLNAMPREALGTTPLMARLMIAGERSDTMAGASPSERATLAPAATGEGDGVPTDFDVTMESLASAESRSSDAPTHGWVPSPGRAPGVGSDEGVPRPEAVSADAHSADADGADAHSVDIDNDEVPTFEAPTRSRPALLRTEQRSAGGPRQGAPAALELSHPTAAAAAEPVSGKAGWRIVAVLLVIVALVVWVVMLTQRQPAATQPHADGAASTAPPRSDDPADPTQAHAVTNSPAGADQEPPQDPHQAIDAGSAAHALPAPDDGAGDDGTPMAAVAMVDVPRAQVRIGLSDAERAALLAEFGDAFAFELSSAEVAAMTQTWWERPALQVMATEVSRALWRAHAASLAPTDACPPPALADSASDDAAAMTEVTPQQAERFCQALGQRLPTSREWEAIARGPAGRAYGLSEAMSPARVEALTSQRRPGELSWNRTSDGVYDLSGSVAEWVTCGADALAYCVDGYAARGGAAGGQAIWLHAALLGRPLDAGASGCRRGPLHGFRCVRP